MMCSCQGNGPSDADRVAPPPPPPPSKEVKDEQIERIHWKDYLLLKGCKRSEDIATMRACNEEVFKNYLSGVLRWPNIAQGAAIPQRIPIAYTISKDYKIRERQLPEALHPEWKRAILRALNQLEANIFQLLPHPKAGSLPYAWPIDLELETDRINR